MGIAVSAIAGGDDGCGPDDGGGRGGCGCGAGSGRYIGLRLIRRRRHDFAFGRQRDVELLEHVGQMARQGVFFLGIGIGFAGEVQADALVVVGGVPQRTGIAAGAELFAVGVSVLDGDDLEPFDGARSLRSK